MCTTNYYNNNKYNIIIYLIYIIIFLYIYIYIYYMGTKKVCMCGRLH